jgi:photosystem II stability/assembly factor-like uncharacterized protein
MSQGNSRFVSPDGDDGWKVQNPGASRASSRHGTQGEAIDAARGYLENQGGGELVVQGQGGQIRQKDTIRPASDPFPPRG